MTTNGGSRRARRWLRLGVVAVGLSLLSGCFLTSAKYHRATSPETRPYFCNAVGDGTPLGGHGNGNHVHPIYEGMTKGELSWEDCLALAEQFDRAYESVETVRTRGAGEAAGWREIAQYIEGLGTHHVRGSFNPGNPSTGFDPARPTFLIYGGTEPDAPLVGLSYAAPGTADPPPAFAGTNDWWHLHQKVCFGADGNILAGAEEIPDEECAALGGRQIDLGPGIWLLHIWIVPRYQLKLDVFASGHPCLGPTGPLAWDDPCWPLANRDPRDGLPPGHEHDH